MPVDSTPIIPWTGGGVSWGGITGTLSSQSDLQTALNAKAALASPTFTGTPLSTTAAVDTNTTQLATTAYVIGQGYAKLASPTFTGVPAGPTAAVDTATTQFASTAYVVNQGYLKSATAASTYAPLASPALTGNPTAPTAAAGDNDTSIATTAYAMSAAPNSSYRTLMECTGSHTAAKVAGTYAMGQGDPIAVSGTGTLYPINTIYIAAADYPTVNGLTAKLRIRARLYTNDVAPTGNFTFGLYPFTRPGTSGGTGLCIYTIGTVIVGSDGATFTTPAADGLLQAVGSDFALPADGHYCIAVVTTGTVAASAHVHLTASLQLHNA